MGRVAFVFPGQGAQKVGMGRSVWEASEAARAVFQLVFAHPDLAALVESGAVREPFPEE